MNQNPRIGVLLRQYKASEELKAALQPACRWGLKRFREDCPPSFLLWSLALSRAQLDEWTRLLERREAEIWKWRADMTLVAKWFTTAKKPGRTP